MTTGRDHLDVTTQDLDVTTQGPGHAWVLGSCSLSLGDPSSPPPRDAVLALF